MIYFDNSATTKPYPESLATYTEVATRIWGNPSSLHNLGSQATRILEASRKQIAELIGKKADEIYFTSGGTEGDNWILKESRDVMDGLDGANLIVNGHNRDQGRIRTEKTSQGIHFDKATRIHWNIIHFESLRL